MVQMLKSVGFIPYGRNGHILTKITACDSNSSTENVSCHVYANYRTVSQTRKKVSVEKSLSNARVNLSEICKQIWDQCVYETLWNAVGRSNKVNCCWIWNSQSHSAHKFEYVAQASEVWKFSSSSCQLWFLNCFPNTTLYTQKMDKICCTYILGSTWQFTPWSFTHTQQTMFQFWC